jgi:hypothetical protein
MSSIAIAHKLISMMTMLLVIRIVPIVHGEVSAISVIVLQQILGYTMETTTKDPVVSIQNVVTVIGKMEVVGGGRVLHRKGYKRIHVRILIVLGMERPDV